MLALELWGLDLELQGLGIELQIQVPGTQDPAPQLQVQPWGQIFVQKQDLRKMPKPMFHSRPLWFIMSKQAPKVFSKSMRKTIV